MQKKFEQINKESNISDLGVSQYDIPYSNKSEKNKLDLYFPAEKKKKYPLLVFIHSGGFFKSDKSRHIANVLNGLLFGYAVSSINYRLNDETRYQGSREDVIEALNYLGSMENIDENKIILWGESYGSYLALDIVVNHSDTLNFSPAGIIDMYCVTDLLDFHYYKVKNGQELMVRGRENDYNTFGDDLEKGIKESAFLDSIDGNEPPIFIIHSKDDGIIPIKYSYALEATLKEKGNKYEAHYVEGLEHGIDNYNTAQYNSLIFNFIFKQIND
ncbi:alpha/beta hydrolase family protein [Breznakia pachnodae]|uniref:Dipeptidyl aminopeptidase/acylaminoacyl peptidase n=1 Tax=Breznakia pachnodae TaxID=265178 RepID=A0ABU0E3J8_9FIRM|nr:prolyl oligopeptidase family serine peptidase [Breznakia pachnodae]MDQ0361462.1 dipeptidyl aminopeptidase/acylaminoacyl peptidase [Breznakia pachnodae]